MARNDNLETPESHNYLFFLLPVSFLKGKKCIPAFVDIESELLVIRSFEKIPKFAYVCYNWVSENGLNESNENLFFILSKLLKGLKGFHYLWIDVSCVDTTTPEEKTYALSQISTIVKEASRILVIPLRMGLDSVPIYDVDSFTRQAWCIFETCIFLKKIPKNRIRFVHCNKSDKTKFTVEAGELSLCCDDDQLFLEGYFAAEEFVAQRNKAAFLARFKPRSNRGWSLAALSEPRDSSATASEPTLDAQTIWEFLVANEKAIFASPPLEDSLLATNAQTCRQSENVRTYPSKKTMQWRKKNNLVDGPQIQLGKCHILQTQEEENDMPTTDPQARFTTHHQEKENAMPTTDPQARLTTHHQCAIQRQLAVKKWRKLHQEKEKRKKAVTAVKCMVRSHLAVKLPKENDAQKGAVTVIQLTTKDKKEKYYQNAVIVEGLKETVPEGEDSPPPEKKKVVSPILRTETSPQRCYMLSSTLRFSEVPEQKGWSLAEFKKERPHGLNVQTQPTQKLPVRKAQALPPQVPDAHVPLQKAQVFQPQVPSHRHSSPVDFMPTGAVMKQTQDSCGISKTKKDCSKADFQQLTGFLKVATIIALMAFTLHLFRQDLKHNDKFKGTQPLALGSKLNAGEYISSCQKPTSGSTNAQYFLMGYDGELSLRAGCMPPHGNVLWKSNSSSLPFQSVSYSVLYDKSGSLLITKDGTSIKTIRKDAVAKEMLGWPLAG